MKNIKSYLNMKYEIHMMRLFDFVVRIMKSNPNLEWYVTETEDTLREQIEDLEQETFDLRLEIDDMKGYIEGLESALRMALDSDQDDLEKELYFHLGKES